MGTSSTCLEISELGRQMNLPLRLPGDGLINVPTNKLSDHKRFDENIPEREDITRTVSVGETADSVPVRKKVVRPVKVDTNGTVKQRRERRVPQYPSA